MKPAAPSSSRLAFRHLLVVVLVTAIFSMGMLLYQIRIQYALGIRAQNDILEMIEESYLPSVAAGVFFFDDHQLQLLAQGIELHPYVESVTILERRSGVDVPIIVAGHEPAENSQTREYPLEYRHDGTIREIGALHVTTSLAQLRQQILVQLRAATAANLLMILGFALVILVVVQRMVFRHLRTITTFVHQLEPEHLGARELVLERRPRPAGGADELDEITGGINTMLARLALTLKEKKALLQELYHRTGNMMQSVRAILRLQSARNGDNAPLQAMVRAVDNRILAIALVHQKLYQRGDLSHVDMREYLDELAREVFRSYSPPRGQVGLETGIDELSLLIDTAIPCGMVLCELLSNSLQHAFSDGRDGTITVTAGRSADGIVRLTVADDGIGVGSDFDIRRDGAIGMQSVIAIVETQLRGSIAFSSGAKARAGAGVRWEIIFSDAIYRERVPNG